MADREMPVLEAQEPAAAGRDVPADTQTPSEGAEGAPGAGPTEEEVANLVAQRGFVWSAWTGAAILTFSYGQVYWAFLSVAYGPRAMFVVGILSGILGAVMLVRSRRMWQELGGTVDLRSMQAATWTGGAGGVFWLLLFLLFVLTLLGVPIQ